MREALRPLLSAFYFVRGVMKRRRVFFIQLSHIRQLLKKFALVILFLIAFVMMLLNKTDTVLIDKTSSVATDIVSPVVDVLILPARLLANAYDYLKDLSLAHKQNQFLKAENRRLRLVSERARSLEIENRLLAKLLNYTRPDEENLVTARVVAEEGDAFSHSLIAYTGKNSTAQKGQIVLTDKGVVGRLDKVGQLYSKILMITDINSRIPVMIENTRVRGILAGDNELNPKLVFTPISADIKEGDRIVTSGVAGVFPAGLPIGVVSHVSKREIRVLPFADLNKVEYVKIVSFPLDEESNLSEAGVVEVRDE